MSIQVNYDDVHNQLTGYGLVIDPGEGLLVGTPRPRRVHIEDGGREKRGWYWLN